MRLKSILTIVLLISLLSPLHSRPRIVFDNTSHDFGNTAQESVLQHTFTFRNRGNSMLKIERVRTG